MGQGFFDWLFSRRQTTSFFAWQVELTTRCPLQCKMCIRDGLTDWRPSDMPIERFKALAPYFRHVENIVLEGWGEPLLYRDLIEAVRTVKAAGPNTGFVTSGWGLDADGVADLVDAGVDFIGFSLAGTTARTHEAIRVYSKLDGILKAIEHFHRIKTDRRRGMPNIHIVYLLMKDNIAEVPLLPDLAKRTGIDRIFLINLIQVSNEWQNGQKVFSCGSAATGSDDHRFLKEAEAKARELGIDLKIPSLAPCTVDVCEEDPTRNLFVSVDGQVAPCVYLYPPVPAPVRRIFCGQPIDTNKITFGNIFLEPLDQIWKRGSYAAFRDTFLKRRRQFELAYSATAALISPAQAMAEAERPLPDPPHPCRTCHRMLGF